MHDYQSSSSRVKADKTHETLAGLADCYHFTEQTIRRMNLNCWRNALIFHHVTLKLSYTNMNISQRAKKIIHMHNNWVQRVSI